MGQSLTFTVSEREDLWRVVLLGPRAQVASLGFRFRVGNPQPPNLHFQHVQTYKSPQTLHSFRPLSPRQVEIPEIEFLFQPKNRRCVDTVYNMIASAVFNLGDHVARWIEGL